MKAKTKLSSIKRIVILRTDRIGEVLLSTPVITAIKRSIPHASISFITSPYAMDIVFDRDDLSEVLAFDTTLSKPVLWHAISLAAKLRKRSFDMALILNPHKLLHLGCFLAGIRYRIGYDRKWAFLLTHRVKDEKAQSAMHEVEYNLGFLKILDILEKDIAPSLPLSKESSLFVDKIFSNSGLLKTAEKKIVAIHPGSSNASKRWPIEKFKEVIKAFIHEGDKEVVLIGDKSEKALCNQIGHDLSQGLHDFSGLFSLKELPVFLKSLDLLITNDNGPMHIAAAVGTKVVAIFRAEATGSNPRRLGPYGEGHATLVDPSPEDVIETVKRIV